MILKIRGYKERDWWVYGEIARAHYETVDSIEGMREDYDLLVFQTEQNLSFGGNNPDEDNPEVPKCLRIILRFANGNVFSILTDSVAYLCNDQGQTIEKIVV